MAGEQTHHYVSREKNRSKQICSTEEINDLFIAVGWLGRRRQINPVLRLIPFFDRGPGFGR